MVGMIIDSYDRTFDDIMQFYSVYRFIDLVQLVPTVYHNCIRHRRVCHGHPVSREESRFRGSRAGQKIPQH